MATAAPGLARCPKNSWGLGTKIPYPRQGGQLNSPVPCCAQKRPKPSEQILQPARLGAPASPAPQAPLHLLGGAGLCSKHAMARLCVGAGLVLLFALCGVQAQISQPCQAKTGIPGEMGRQAAVGRECPVVPSPPLSPPLVPRVPGLLVGANCLCVWFGKRAAPRTSPGRACRLPYPPLSPFPPVPPWPPAAH